MQHEIELYVITFIISSYHIYSYYIVSYGCGTCHSSILIQKRKLEKQDNKSNQSNDLSRKCTVSVWKTSDSAVKSVN